MNGLTTSDMIQLVIAVVMLLTFLFGATGSILTGLWMIWNAQRKINVCYKQLTPNGGASMDDRLRAVERQQGKNTVTIDSLRESHKDLHETQTEQTRMLKATMRHFKIEPLILEEA